MICFVVRTTAPCLTFLKGIWLVCIPPNKVVHILICANNGFLPLVTASHLDGDVNCGLKTLPLR